MALAVVSVIFLLLLLPRIVLNSAKGLTITTERLTQKLYSTVALSYFQKTLMRLHTSNNQKPQRYKHNGKGMTSYK